MFAYYGRKKRLGHLYPKPEQDTIIEPFAGSAAYALQYPEHDVLLIDKDPKIAAVWRYLVAATPRDILALPVLRAGESLDAHAWLSQEERWFVGYSIAAAQRPRSVCSRLGATNWTESIRARVAMQVRMVDHWRVECGDYSEAPDIVGTWFIDPPYRGRAGEAYTHGSRSIDYAALGDWARSRSGQIIACENAGADWLPFTALAANQGAYKYQRVEAIWTNTNVAAEAAS